MILTMDKIQMKEVLIDQCFLFKTVAASNRSFICMDQEFMVVGKQRCGFLLVMVTPGRGFKILGEGFTIILGYKALAILKLKTDQVTKHVNLSGSTAVT